MNQPETIEVVVRFAGLNDTANQIVMMIIGAWAGGHFGGMVFRLVSGIVAARRSQK